MKKLFETIKAWLRSRVTALRSEEGKVKSEELKDTQNLYTDKSLVKVKGDGVKVKKKQEIFNSQFSTFNSKKSLTLPEVQAVLRSKYAIKRLIGITSE